MKEYKFYSLIDTHYREVFYVGLTTRSLEQRLYEHLKEAKDGKNSNKCNRIREILSQGFDIEVELLEEAHCGSKEASAIEREWVNYFEASGAAIENELLITDVDDGVRKEAGLILNQVLSTTIVSRIKQMIRILDPYHEFEHLERFTERLESHIVFVLLDSVTLTDASEDLIIESTIQKAFEFAGLDEIFDEVLERTRRNID